MLSVIYNLKLATHLARIQNIFEYLCNCQLFKNCCFIIRKPQQGKEMWYRARNLRGKKNKGEKRWERKVSYAAAKGGKEASTHAAEYTAAWKNRFKLCKAACYWHHQRPVKTWGSKQKSCRASSHAVPIHICCWAQPSWQWQLPWWQRGAAVPCSSALKAGKRSCATVTVWPCVGWNKGLPFTECKVTFSYL